MIRFLGAATVITLLYLSFTALSYVDYQILITVHDYIIETTIFNATMLLVATICLILILLKIIVLFFEIPSLLKQHFLSIKSRKTSNMLITAMSWLVIGNKQEASAIVKKITKKIKPEHQELYLLVKAELESDFDQQIQFLQNLLTSKDYNYFALKRLAQIFYHHGLYEQSEKYAAQAFSIINNDIDILEILIDCYAKLVIWHKFISLVSRFNKLNKEKLLKKADKIAEHYLAAAKYFLELGNDQEAIYYLESALELSPTYSEALNLYFALNANLNKIDTNLILLKKAFSAAPSFDIAEIYIKFANMPAEAVYQDLASQIDNKQFSHLLLMIATYLGLNTEIELLKEQRALPYYQ